MSSVVRIIVTYLFCVERLVLEPLPSRTLSLNEDWWLWVVMGFLPLRFYTKSNWKKSKLKKNFSCKNKWKTEQGHICGTMQDASKENVGPIVNITLWEKHNCFFHSINKASRDNVFWGFYADTRDGCSKKGGASLFGKIVSEMPIPPSLGKKFSTPWYIEVVKQ